MPRIQSQMKLRKMRLRNYLQHTEKGEPSETLMEAQGARQVGDPETGRQRH